MADAGAEGILDALDRMSEAGSGKPRQGRGAMVLLKAPVTAHDHWRGDPDAPVVLIEYGDYQCPYCAAAHPIVKELLDSFHPSLALVFRHFPLSEAHPMAFSAAQTAEFAGERNRFWEMHDSLYTNASRLSLQTLLAQAEALGLPTAELETALTSSRYAEKIRSDFLSGVRGGVNGTPCFFINGVRHDGAWNFDELAAAIQAAQMRPPPAQPPLHGGYP
jgi:protein-disulfide isomerase